jgi:hypothetical protein
MTLHVILFGLYLIVLLAILRRLETPVRCANPGGFAGATFTTVRTVWRNVRHGGAFMRDSFQPALFSDAKPMAVARCRLRDSRDQPADWRHFAFWLVIGQLGVAVSRRERMPRLPLAVIVVVPVALVGLAAARWLKGSRTCPPDAIAHGRAGAEHPGFSESHPQRAGPAAGRRVPLLVLGQGNSISRPRLTGARDRAAERPDRRLLAVGSRCFF